MDALDAREQSTQPLLAGERDHAEEARSSPNCAVNGEAKPDGYTSPITGVLLLSTLVAVCGSLSYGFSASLWFQLVGYTAPVESEITEDLGLTTAEYSLFGSFITLGAALGSLVCGKTSDYLGRRGAFGVADVLSIGGWLAITLSPGTLSLYLGRLLLGLAAGLNLYAVPIFIAEITPKDHRGGFVLLHLLMICTGVTFVYILGLFTPWRVLAAIGIIPSVSQLIGIFFIPESPRWLMKVHKEEGFEVVLQRLRGTNTNISQEAADIKDHPQALGQTSEVSIFQLFQRKYAYTLTVGAGLIAISQLSGINAILYYATSIFVSAGLSSTLGTLLMAFIQVPPVLLAVALMDRHGRRPLLMVSASGVCVCCALTGVSFVLEDRAWLGGFSPYLALISILTYPAFYSIGLGGIPPLIISEIYPIDIKGLAGGLANFCGFAASWVLVLAFNFSMEWSKAGTFFILAGVCGLILLFVVKLVPETKGKTLEEIQEFINQKFPTEGGLS